MEFRNRTQHLRWDPALGGRLVSWRIGAMELLAHHGDHPVEFGMYPMAPWAGRVRGNQISPQDLHRMGIPAAEPIDLPINYPPWALHGTCFMAPVDSVSAVDNTVIFRQRIPQWPWSAELTNTWNLHEDGIDITSTVQSDAATPVILGWHPWFHRQLNGASAQWSMNSATVSLRSDSLPTDRWLDLDNTSGPYDDVFHCSDKRVDITWPGVLSLSLTSSHPWFVIFDESPDAICVEPQTQMPNAWRSPISGEPDIARPGADVTLTTHWRWIMDGA